MIYEIRFETDRLTRLLEALRREISDDELLTAFGESLLNTNRARHRAGLGPDGNPWKPLAASTLAAGKRKGGPLNKSGRMLQNLHYQVSGASLHLGFDDGDGFPAKFHQDGSRAHVITPRHKKALAFMGIVRKRVQHPGLPARPLIGFPDSYKALIEDTAEDYLKTILSTVRS
ncbi:MAG: phage virion morphogenesis protein [Zoogloeaceae bacterium]|jgi:phage gpG-like protein|nr:phage virion morphogenesis protein [Zoogloeaceae bacterium]